VTSITPHSLVLPLQSGSVQINIDDTGWASWRLRADGITLELGAEALEVLAPRIINRLTHRCESAGDIDGASVQWVCSFAEHHYTIYCVWSPTDRLLVFQDGSAQARWRSVLTAEQLDQWTKAFASILRPTGDSRAGALSRNDEAG